MGFSSYVGVPRSISASCSRLASSPGLSQVGGSHWVCLEEDRQTERPPSLLKVTGTCLLIVPSTGTIWSPSVIKTLNMGVTHGPVLLLMMSLSRLQSWRRLKPSKKNLKTLGQVLLPAEQGSALGTSSQAFSHRYLLVERTQSKDLEKGHRNEQELERMDGQMTRSSPIR